MCLLPQVLGCGPDAGSGPTGGYPTVTEPCMGYNLYGTGREDRDNKTQVPEIRLTDMEGRILRTWKLIGYPPKFFADGSVMGGQPVSGVWFDLEVATLARYSWDGVPKWTYNGWGTDPTGGVPSARQSHDYQREGSPVGYYAPGQLALAGGATLVSAREDRVVTFPAGLGTKQLRDDVVYMVSAAGDLLDFRWRAGDHLRDLGFDDTTCKNLFFRDDPEKMFLNLNSVTWLGKNRWYDQLGDARFHPKNILIASRDANVLAILDHKTGKTVWRIGPDFKGRPEEGLGQIIGCHNAHMIPAGLPGEGNILVLDNGGLAGIGDGGRPKHARSYSRVLEFDPVTLREVWSYGPPPPSDASFFTSHLGGAQRLPNGNTLVTNGAKGELFEVTWWQKQVVWRHDIRWQDNGLIEGIYRANRVPPQWVPGNPKGYAHWGTW